MFILIKIFNLTKMINLNLGKGNEEMTVSNRFDDKANSV